MLARLFGDMKIEEMYIASFCEFFRSDNNAFDEGVFREAIKERWGKATFRTHLCEVVSR